MELVVEPDLYCPSIDESGNYVDKIPSFHKKGILCPCGARKDKVYETHPMFTAHVKTKTHLKWLIHLNLNKANYYTENEILKKTIQNQRLIIAKMEKDISTKIATIDCLTQMLQTANKDTFVEDLLDFD